MHSYAPLRYSWATLCHLTFLSPSVCTFQLRLTVAEAVGSMSHLMANDKLEEQIPKLIPSILTLYKKNNEHYIISKVCMGFSIVTSFYHRSGDTKFFPCHIESMPSSGCFHQHGQQGAGDSTGLSTSGTASAGTLQKYSICSTNSSCSLLCHLVHLLWTKSSFVQNVTKHVVRCKMLDDLKRHLCLVTNVGANCNFLFSSSCISLTS